MIVSEAKVDLDLPELISYLGYVSYVGIDNVGSIENVGGIFGII